MSRPPSRASVIAHFWSPGAHTVHRGFALLRGGVLGKLGAIRTSRPHGRHPVTGSSGAAEPRPADRAALRGLPPTVRDSKGRVRHEALTEAVTELPNRLHFDVVYRLMWEAGGRGIPVTVIRFDLTGFD